MSERFGVVFATSQDAIDDDVLPLILEVMALDKGAIPVGEWEITTMTGAEYAARYEPEATPEQCENVVMVRAYCWAERVQT